APTILSTREPLTVPVSRACAWEGGPEASCRGEPRRVRHSIDAAERAITTAKAMRITAPSTAPFSAVPAGEAGIPAAANTAPTRQRTRPRRACWVAATAAVAPTMTRLEVVACCGLWPRR